MNSNNLIADKHYIPLSKYKSSQVLELVTNGVSRKILASEVDHYQGAPLEDLEGKRYGYWLIDRYVNECGENCLKLNDRHLSGDIKLDLEARRIRRKQRASDCLKKNNKEIKRSSKVQFENSEAQKEYFLSLGESANDSESKKSTER
ncbi:hypothetical protein [Psychromonas hadalis]|uniref:hypothetical protein n=1 Tax=Psychromonas hadalis TaxID=211669 RepID=UPI0003B2FA9E|nr:hypothetical protein [Psychromonas hadalis]